MTALLRWVVFVVGVIVSVRLTDPGTVPAGSAGGEPGSNATNQPQPGEEPAPPSGDDKTKRERRFSQAEVDALITNRLAEEQNRAKTRETAAQRKAAEDALKQNQEWQTLAEQRGTELEQAQTRAQAADRYAERLNGWVESEIKGWPKEVTALDPGKDRLEERLTWMENARPLAAKLASLPTPPNTEGGARTSGPPTTPPAPAPGGSEQPKTYRFQQAGDVQW